MQEWTIEVDSEVPGMPDAWLEALEGAVRATLAAESAPGAHISVALLSDPRIAALNSEYLGHSGPTDVISFALSAPGAPLAGDLYLGVEQAERQAAEEGVEVREELLRLVIHGTLHVLGWDHPEEAERAHSPMYLRQEALLHDFLRGS